MLPAIPFSNFGSDWPKVVGQLGDVTPQNNHLIAGPVKQRKPGQRSQHAENHESKQNFDQKAAQIQKSYAKLNERTPAEKNLKLLKTCQHTCKTFDGKSIGSQKNINAVSVFNGISENFRKFDKTIKRLSMFFKFEPSQYKYQFFAKVWPERSSLKWSLQIFHFLKLWKVLQKFLQSFQCPWDFNCLSKNYWKFSKVLKFSRLGNPWLETYRFRWTFEADTSSDFVFRNIIGRSFMIALAAGPESSDCCSKSLSCVSAIKTERFCQF